MGAGHSPIAAWFDVTRLLAGARPERTLSLCFDSGGNALVTRRSGGNLAEGQLTDPANSHTRP